jgi:hypothetical protein
MMRNLILTLTIISLVSATEVLYQSKFLMDNEKWQITGNKKIEPAEHQSYNLNSEISHYIMFKDNLINVDYKNPDDKSIWYFESPEIIINNVPRPGTTASQRFQPKYPTGMTFTMTSFVGDFNEFNENTKLVKLRHGTNCLTFDAPIYNGNTRLFNVPFINTLWRHDIHESDVTDDVTDDEMKDMFLGPFTIEILGDWTRGYEVIGLDNVIIYM